MKMSIITPALNRVQCVENVILNVQSQGISDIEHLIVDGGSTDGSLELYQQYSHLVVSVEKDENVYDAFNKGIHQSRGEIIGIMNTDDVYPLSVLKRVMDLFESDPSIEMISGGCRFRSFGESNENTVLYSYLHEGVLNLDPGSLVRYPVMVNARFYRRSLFERIGFFDINYPVVADRDFLLRCSLKGVNNKSLPEVFCEYGVHSGAISHRKEGVGLQILEENLNCATQRSKSTSDRDEKNAFNFWMVWSVILLFKQLKRDKGVVVSLKFLKPYLSLLLRFTPTIMLEIGKHWMERNQKFRT